ncbi:hypothetical protein M951_chr2111 (nucleomorph) [Lotharella oceanica]|uniref:Uncharacterized protein n=2 Tax=Lotharella oceanica TaxID=641309 RepID=A0A060DAU6_9EUKA|nr:hypothetical protein M951_chr2111 [Lotharella oceanica]
MFSIILFISILNNHFGHYMKIVKKNSDIFVLNLLIKYNCLLNKKNDIFIIGNIGIGKIALLTKLVNKKNHKHPYIHINSIQFLNNCLENTQYRLDYLRASIGFNFHDSIFYITGYIKSISIKYIKYEQSKSLKYPKYICLLSYKSKTNLLLLDIFDLIFIFTYKSLNYNHLTLKFSINSCRYTLCLFNFYKNSPYFENSFLLYTYSYHSTVLDLDNSIFQCMYNNIRYILTNDINIIQIQKFLKTKTNKLINYYYKKQLIGMRSGVIVLEWNHFIKNMFFYSYIYTKSFLFSPGYLITMTFYIYKNSYCNSNTYDLLHGKFICLLFYQNYYTSYLTYLIINFKILKIKYTLSSILFLLILFIYNYTKLTKIFNFIYKYIFFNNYKNIGILTMIKISKFLRN